MDSNPSINSTHYGFGPTRFTSNLNRVELEKKHKLT